MSPNSKLRIALTFFGVFGIFAFTDASACTTDSWSGKSGLVVVDTPASDVPRINGSCGMKVTGLGYVQDNSPNQEAKFIGRFYFYPTLDGTGSPEIFIAYSDEAATELFSVSYDQNNIIIDATAAGGNSVSTPVTGEVWHLIEFSWESGQPGSLWVDVDATSNEPSANFNSGTGVVESVRFGAPNGFDTLTGEAFFDDYVSHRNTAIGGVLAGDANLDGSFTQADIDAITTEFLDGTYPNGSTDCNLDSAVNSGDVNCVVINSLDP